MKHLFIMNPISGEAQERDRIRANIKKVCSELKLDFEIYESKFKGDASQFVISRTNDIIQGLKDEACKLKSEVRFYFCGGDGYAYEAADSFMRLPDVARCGLVELGVIPIGTGNDFIKNFGYVEDFLDIKKQVEGKAISVDAMRFEGDLIDGRHIVKHSANMFNIGFDCQVVKRVNNDRHRVRALRKKFAYPIGVVKELIKFPHTDLEVSFPDGTERRGRYLLTLVANGKFCGGGFRAANDAVVNDGMLDCMMVDPLSRLNFIRFVDSYKKGKILKTKLGREHVFYKRTPSISLVNKGGVDVCIDGEIETFTKITISSVKHALPFSVPANSKVISIEGAM